MLYESVFVSLFTGGGRYDPGIRSKIFSPMVINDDGYREVDGNFVLTNPMLKCDTQWTESIYHTFDEYIE